MTDGRSTEHQLSEHDWLLIETLGRTPDGQCAVPTLVSDGTKVKDWARLLRVRRELHAAAPQRIIEVVQRCVETAESVTHCETGLVVHGVPIVCAFDEVHGVQVWAGTADQQPPPRLRVAAWDWEADTELAHHGPGLEELVFARAPEDVRVIRTPPEAFGRMVRFEGRIDYFATVGTLDGRHQSEVDMLGDDGVVRSFQMVTRADPVARRIRAVMHEFADAAPAQPHVDMTMLRAVSQRADDGVGFVGLSSCLIYEWTRTPAPPLDRWAVERPKVHPDDLADFRAACAELAAEPAGTDARHLRLRVRFTDTEWIPVRAELSPVLPAASGQGLIKVWPE
ncbi:GAF domain-containing protein [Nocardia sp. XZ_19_369]|uniref:GAF domain-containing protein n=1 Tax=Nocardia sp. XZ_19_369 TaxID=2769487 RepID=UPI00188DE131|nr:GAF domain-containing protein [Nocardia sp. XZ_19_369]